MACDLHSVYKFSQVVLVAEISPAGFCGGVFPPGITNIFKQNRISVNS